MRGPNLVIKINHHEVDRTTLLSAFDYKLDSVVKVVKVKIIYF